MKLTMVNSGLKGLMVDEKKCLPQNDAISVYMALKQDKNYPPKQEWFCSEPTFVKTLINLKFQTKCTNYYIN